MGSAFSICGTCNVDVVNSIETIEKDVIRLDNEINRVRSRLHDISDIVIKTC